ncbi:hypothetical protein K435DRAFT_879666 [Dendrothele bispora CBS 962.96]|uniref:Heterokaryon incompatibility domain-containing protein n=1 Tax=Dendrothele bispora (strain CBS 962.96) TaxID=1314807 RepID=A0A4S8KL25_DENBC|nr:hypothetical protein K435DRAFT_879666 [Dendrothele bispora CBS 962.96]
MPFSPTPGKKTRSPFEILIQDLHEADEKAGLEAEGLKKQAGLLKVKKVIIKAGWLKIWRSCDDVSSERNVKDLTELELKGSQWFMRGWTLQELIAPRYMVFLDKHWDKIGTRYGIWHVVSEVTSIPVEIFEDGRLDNYSIAQKMSWAAPRQTT